MTGRDFGRDRLAGRGDDVYEALMRAHDGLDAAESARLNARLVLILANLAGDPDGVIEAIGHAARNRETGGER
ncbi:MULTISPECIES: DUF2783 domain-containing protein [Inquilinus]|jgi:hypothetical protein|uniref:DUF2783 domain-containing protein n=1 Tax=Inquilinus ginsengisoli TaxID=363840 RepID=A0ABU1JL78_9PROT|nr:DUF2783 domain-containing protein [Inquilinus ginsengisoli]MDR6289366.1 hypothetical protein [Inquilinus ginsengisoli]